MGKAGRWLRSFFVTGRNKGWKARDKQADCDDTQSTVSSAALPTPASTSSAREKRRWSFRQPAAAVASKVVEAGAPSSSSQCFSEPAVRLVVVQDQHAGAVAESADAAGTGVVHLPRPPGASGGGGDEVVAAAIKIQSAFRSYLARKARCALRGMVKLQAMVRGQLVRRQASVTLRRMQALVDAQMRARAERLRLLEDDGGGGRQLPATTPPPSLCRRRSLPQHARSRKPPEAAEARRSSVEESGVIKIVEVDDARARRGGGSTCYSDASARTGSGRFDDASFTSAPEPPGRRSSKAFPNYMAITESSRARARRSQSAPRQRLLAARNDHGTAAASPSPSRGSRNGSGGARRRASLDPLDLLGGVARVVA